MANGPKNTPTNLAEQLGLSASFEIKNSEQGADAIARNLGLDSKEISDVIKPGEGTQARIGDIYRLEKHSGDQPMAFFRTREGKDALLKNIDTVKSPHIGFPQVRIERQNDGNYTIGELKISPTIAQNFSEELGKLLNNTIVKCASHNGLEALSSECKKSDTGTAMKIFETVSDLVQNITGTKTDTSSIIQLFGVSKESEKGKKIDTEIRKILKSISQ